MSALWLLLKALLGLIPFIWAEIRAGRAKTGALDEMSALIAARHRRRVIAAMEARNEEHDPRVPDPYDRANAVSVRDDDGRTSG